uniref:MIP04048p n=1 Tax=Drosophila melanogaster TaxID=7227 RepID=B9ER16_DROME|nr:MIP04048p [Drosophila melanogaster]
MYDQVIFTAELLHHRTVGSQIEETRRHWEERCSWFPAAQRNMASRCSEIYKESLEKYGNDYYEFYANRNRLKEEHRVNTKSYKRRERRRSHRPMDHLKDYRVSPTSNGGTEVFGQCFSFNGFRKLKA